MSIYLDKVVMKYMQLFINEMFFEVIYMVYDYLSEKLYIIVS
jgi:hypothetical protein